ncbi:MAG: tetratricopeptide repeat protein [Planctomycetota bacterium]
MNHFAIAVGLVWGLTVVFGACPVRALSATPPTKTAPADATSGREAQPAGLEIEEPVLPLRPKRLPTAAEADRVDAQARFAAARAIDHQGRSAEALRMYQRAHRLDPQAAAIVRAIVPLAYRLDRHDVAVRYALRAVALEDADPLLLRRLGVHLTGAGRWTDAISLYKQAVAARAQETPGAADVLLSMELGRLYHLNGQVAEAADAFDRVRDALKQPEVYELDDNIREILVGDPGLTFSLMGQCYLEAGRSDEALAVFEMGQQAAANEGLWQYNRAQVLARKERWQEAAAALDAAFAATWDVEDEGPYALLAKILEKLGRGEQALARLDALRATRDDDVALAVYLAAQYEKAGQPEKAIALYQELARKSSYSDVHRELVRLLRQTDQKEELIRALGQAVEQTGLIEVLAGEDEAIADNAALLDALLAIVNRRLESDADLPTYGESLGMALLALEAKRFENAATLFERALKAATENAGDAYLLWGIGLLVSERGPEAAKVFQRAIDSHARPKDNPLYRFYLAAALAIDGKTQEALEAARQASTEMPHSARFLGRVAWVHYQAKQYDEALPAYGRVIQRFDADYQSPDNRDALREARLVLSNLHVLRGEMPEAEEWLEQILDEFPEDIGALNDLGYLWADQGKNLHRALPMLEKAVAAEPENPAFRDSLGWVYHRLGRRDDAVRELKQAADTQPDGVILDHLGDALQAAGRRPEAEDAWRRAAAAFEKLGEADKAKAVRTKLAEQTTSTQQPREN